MYLPIGAEPWGMVGPSGGLDVPAAAVGGCGGCGVVRKNRCNAVLLLRSRVICIGDLGVGGGGGGRSRRKKGMERRV